MNSEKYILKNEIKKNNFHKKIKLRNINDLKILLYSKLSKEYDINLIGENFYIIDGNLKEIIIEENN